MFSIRLKELRESAGYRSQQSFADAFGVAQSTVGNWEAGKREPNYEITIRLADFFGVSIDYLLGHTTAEAPRREAPIRDGNLFRLEQLYAALTPDRQTELLRFAEYQYSQSAGEPSRKKA